MKISTWIKSISGLLLTAGLLGSAYGQNLGSAGPANINCANCSSVVNLGAAPTGGASVTTILSAASNNSTSIKASAGTVYSLTFIQTTSTAIQDIRFYDTATAPTCSSATGMKVNIPVQANTVTPGGTFTFGTMGIAFASGIGICITGANANNDNTNAATGLNVVVSYQ